MKRSRSLLGALFVLAAAAASAETLPQRINFQGKLINPVTNNPQAGPVTLEFCIYNAPTGGTCASGALYSETQTNVPLTNGVFSVQIGTVTALTRDLFLGASVYIGVTVGGDSEMTPRQNLVMSGYAFTANQLSDTSEVRLIAGLTYSTFTSLGNLTVPGGVNGSSASFTNGITASSGTFTATGNGFALALSTSISFVGNNGEGIHWADGTVSTTASSGGSSGVTGGGTPNTIPVWSGSSALGNSHLIDVNSPVATTTMTVQGFAFSVGGSSFSVAGGSGTLAYQFSPGSISMTGSTGTLTSFSSVTASAFFGNGAVLTGIPSTGSISGFYFPLAGGALNAGAALTQSGSGGFITSFSSVNASAFFGSGAALTGIPSSGSIVGVYAALAATQTWSGSNTFTDPIAFSSAITITSTLAVQGYAFSVGGSSFTVGGGSATAAYQLQALNLLATSSATAGAFFGNGAALTGIPSTGSISGFYYPLAGGALNAGAALTQSGSGGFITNFSSVNASAFFGSGAALTGIPSSGSISGVYGALAGTQTWSGSNTFTDPITISSAITIMSTMAVRGYLFTVGGSSFVVSGGSVSIGDINVNPNATLDVTGSANFDSSATAGAFFGDGSKLTGIPSTGSISGVYGALAGTQTWSGSNTFTDPIAFSSAITITSTLAVQGYAFSVGGSSFTVGGGSATAAYQLQALNLLATSSATAGAFFGNGSRLAGIPSTGSISGYYGLLTGTQTWSGSNTFTDPITLSSAITITSTMAVEGNAFSVGGSSFTVGGGSATVAYSLTAKSLFGLTFSSAALNGNVTMTTASTWYSAVSLTLGAGTYFVKGHITMGKAAAVVDVEYAQIIAGATTVASGQAMNPAINPHATTIPLGGIVTLAGSTAVQLEGTSSVASGLIYAAMTANGVGNNATGLYVIRLY